MEVKGYVTSLEFPDRWWFRYLIYIQAIYLVLNPQSVSLLSLVWIMTLYLLRSPDMWIVDSGILIRVLWSYRVISWGNIRKVRLTPTQILIYDGFLIPIFALKLRRNFKEMQQTLEERIPDKVSRYSFPFP